MDVNCQYNIKSHSLWRLIKKTRLLVTLWTLVVLLIITVKLEASIEFICENIGGQAEKVIFIPYADFFIKREPPNMIVDTHVSISILNEQQDIVFAKQQQIKLVIDKEALSGSRFIRFENEYYPLTIQSNLKPGDYNLIVIISSLGHRREYREQFVFQDQEEDVGSPLLIASIGDFLFAVRDKVYLKDRYDELVVWQSSNFIPDNSLVLIKYSQRLSSNDRLIDTEYMMFNQYLNKITEIVDLGQQFTIKVFNQKEDRIFFNNPLYPSHEYFFQKRYSTIQQLNQLRYILNQNEYQMLRSLEIEDLQEGIDSYWAGINPNSYSIDNYYQQIFYQRVKHADINFGVSGYLNGWQTDRGRIYIKYGEPGNISSDRFPIGRDPSITWHYYRLNKSFTFYDLKGYGNYELRQKWID